MATSGIPGDLSEVSSLTKHGGSAWWTSYFPLKKPESKESSTLGNSNKDSMEGSSQRELQYQEAP